MTAQRLRVTALTLIGGAGLLVAGSMTACKDAPPPPKPAVAEPPPPQVYTTGRGEQSLYTLPGRTVVTLGPAAELRHQAPATGFAQSVTVTGQARIVVTGDSSVSYTITVGDVTLETSKADMSVRSYASDSSVQIVVVGGTVAATVGDSSLTWKAGDVATIPAGGTLKVRHLRDVSSLVEWTDGSMHYDAVPFRKIIPDLERAFDITIIAEDGQILREPVTAVFHMGSYTDMLATLTPIIDATFKVDDRTIRLAHDPAPGRPTPPPPHRHEH
jgi:ferric-dicitrate binding protein FerR (iron transport regulator)